MEKKSKEIWKDIAGFEGVYMVSNFGRVKSCDRMVNRKSSKPFFICGKILAPNIVGAKGKRYYAVQLQINGKRHPVGIHRLVAQTFIPNPNGYPCVNHKDEVKTNNFVYINEDGSVDLEKSNLEWCTYSYNNTYDNLKERIRPKMINNKKFSRPVSQFSEDGIYITTFPSIAEAVRKTSISSRTIRCSCKNNDMDFSKKKTRFGYRWRYAEKNGGVVEIYEISN